MSVAPRLPPRWFVRAAWVAHRALYAATRGGLGLRRQTPTGRPRCGSRRSGAVRGAERTAILGYFEDGPNLVTMAMNGWADAEPAWWLNLQANPDTPVDLTDGPRAVRGRAATQTSGPACRAVGRATTRSLTAGRPETARNRGRHPRATAGAAWNRNPACVDLRSRASRPRARKRGAPG